MGHVYNRNMGSFLGVKIVYLVERTYLCKISKLVYGDKEIVMCLYSMLQGQRQFMAAIES